jgi:hypothetical protein
MAHEDLGIDFTKLAGLIDAGFTAPDVIGTVGAGGRGG